MSKFVTLTCPRCRKTQPDAWYSRKVCAGCRVEEERGISRAPKGRAWAAVTKAIKSGNLVRLSCEACGAEKSQAHHDDYAKPLDVRWLCRGCHRRHHVKHGPGKNDYSPSPQPY